MGRYLMKLGYTCDHRFGYARPKSFEKNVLRIEYILLHMLDFNVTTAPSAAMLQSCSIFPTVLHRAAQRQPWLQEPPVFWELGIVFQLKPCLVGHAVPSPWRMLQLQCFWNWDFHLCCPLFKIGYCHTWSSWNHEIMFLSYWCLKWVHPTSNYAPFPKVASRRLDSSKWEQTKSRAPQKSGLLYSQNMITIQKFYVSLRLLEFINVEWHIISCI